jgi:hypothetical protein
MERKKVPSFPRRGFRGGLEKRPPTSFSREKEGIGVR